MNDKSDKKPYIDNRPNKKFNESCMKPKVHYTPELRDEICRAIATNSCGLQKLCDRNPHFPVRQTINEWRYDYPDFHEAYYKARTYQIDLLAEEMIDIADDRSNDTIIRKGHDGEEKEYANTEWINRSRLRVDARKWMAMKLLPKVYGDCKPDSINQTAEGTLEKIQTMVADFNKTNNSDI